MPRVIRGGDVYFLVADDDLVQKIREQKKARKRAERKNRKRKNQTKSSGSKRDRYFLFDKLSIIFYIKNRPLQIEKGM